MNTRTKPIPRTILLVAILTILGIALLGGSCNRSSVPERVEIGSFSVAIDYAPYFVAKSKGWFEESLRKGGINVHYTTFQSLPPINESFATSRVDVVFEAEPPAIIGKSGGIDIRIVGISCSLTQEVIVSAVSKINSIQELKGKRIAVLAGTSSHYGLLKIAQQGGLARSDIQILDLRPPDAKSAFRTGQVDAWAVWPPWVEQELVDGTGRVLPGGNAQIHSIMAVRGQFADRYPAQLHEILGVLKRAKKWIKENPKEAQSIVAKELGLPSVVVAKAWPKHDWAAVIGPSVITDIQAKADFLKGEGVIRKPVNVERDLIYRVDEE